MQEGDNLRVGFVEGARMLERSTRRLADYHRNWTGQSYLRWFTTQLLPNVPPRSLIVMDNARYHRWLGLPKSISCMKKAELIDWLRENGQQVDNVDTRSTLIGKVKLSARPAIVRACEADNKGCDVVFQPPYHSCLNPIEHVWAYVKDHVASLYDEHTALSDVHTRLEEGFVWCADPSRYHMDRLFTRIECVEQEYLSLEQRLDEREDEGAERRQVEGNDSDTSASDGDVSGEEVSEGDLGESGGAEDGEEDSDME